MPNESTQVVVRPMDQLKAGLAQMEPQYAVALGDQISPAKFKNAVLTAVNLNPDLLDADRQSFYTASMRAAQDGLLPDGREGAMVVFNTKVKRGGEDRWVKMVQWLPMVYGVLKKLRSSGELASIVAHEVYEKDTFDYVLGDDERIEHKPLMSGDRGQVIAAYMIAKLKDGSIQREVMLRADIDRARAFSRSKDGPAWTNWFGEMARKSVIHRGSKYLPMSPDIAEFMTRHAKNIDGAGAVVDAEHNEVTDKALPRPTDKLSAFEGEQHDSDGVVIDRTPRKRRTKAEIEADRIAESEPPAEQQSQQEVPTDAEIRTVGDAIPQDKQAAHAEDHTGFPQSEGVTEGQPHPAFLAEVEKAKATIGTLTASHGLKTFFSNLVPDVAFEMQEVYNARMAVLRGMGK